MSLTTKRVPDATKLVAAMMFAGMTLAINAPVPAQDLDKLLSDRYLSDVTDPIFKVFSDPSRPQRSSESWKSEGWKIHVSLNENANGPARDLMSRIATELVAAQVDHKLVHPDNFKQMTDSQKGKYITVYPRNADEWKSVVQLLDRTIPAGTRHPAVRNDMKVFNDKPIYTRYGAYGEKDITVPKAYESATRQKVESWATKNSIPTKERTVDNYLRNNATHPKWQAEDRAKMKKWAESHSKRTRPSTAPTASNTASKNDRLQSFLTDMVNLHYHGQDAKNRNLPAGARKHAGQQGNLLKEKHGIASPPSFGDLEALNKFTQPKHSAADQLRVREFFERQGQGSKWHMSQKSDGKWRIEQKGKTTPKPPPSSKKKAGTPTGRRGGRR